MDIVDIERFNQEANVCVILDADNLRLKTIFDKRKEIQGGIARLKLALKMLDTIHDKYTLSLEPKE